MLQSSIIVFGHNALTVEDILAVTRGTGTPVLSDDAEFRARIDQGCRFLDRLLEESGVIYGVTTGYGDSCTRGVEGALVHELPIHLSRFHGCGLGETLSPMQGRAVLAVRLASLTSGTGWRRCWPRISYRLSRPRARWGRAVT
jgi:histidine ammonia-lyase